MGLNSIDYSVYKHTFEKEQDFIDYLININGGGLIKNYSLSINYAWELVDEISKKYDFKLIKLQTLDTYQCIISKIVNDETMLCSEYKDGYAESEIPSMAICLAIIDLFEAKDSYETEATRIIKELNEQRSLRIKELEAIGIKFKSDY